MHQLSLFSVLFTSLKEDSFASFMLIALICTPLTFCGQVEMRESNNVTPITEPDYDLKNLEWFSPYRDFRVRRETICIPVFRLCFQIMWKCFTLLNLIKLFVDEQKIGLSSVHYGCAIWRNAAKTFLKATVQPKVKLWLSYLINLNVHILPCYDWPCDMQLSMMSWCHWCQTWLVAFTDSISEWMQTVDFWEKHEKRKPVGLEQCEGNVTIFIFEKTFFFFFTEQKKVQLLLITSYWALN